MKKPSFIKLINNKYVFFFFLKYINETYLESNILGLKGVLEIVLEFITSNHNFLTLAHEIKGSSTTTLSNETDAASSTSSVEFEFILNSIFASIVTMLDLNLHSIFSPADPDQFHSHFNSMFTFLADFELKCVQYDPDIKRKLVGSQSYKYLIKKWPVNVYFQIRFQEIVCKFEEDLLGAEKLAGREDDDERFFLKSTDSLVKSMEYSWLESKCFLKCLLGLFWKLNLQLVSRYCFYYVKMFENKKKDEEAVAVVAATSVNSGGSGTGTASQESHPAFNQNTNLKENEDFNLCIMLINDVDKLVYQKVCYL